MEVQEFLRELEDAFSIRISDQAATSLTTPGMLIDFLASVLPRSESAYSLADRMFAVLLAAFQRCSVAGLETVTTSTSLKELFPDVDKGLKWNRVGSITGAKYWPRIGKPGWWFWHGNTSDSPKLSTMAELVTFLVARCPSLAKSGDSGWARGQIAETVRALMGHCLGIPDKEFSETKTFVKDYGLYDI